MRIGDERPVAANEEQGRGRSLVGVFRVTVEGKFLECNAGMARILGYSTPEDLMGVDLRELYVDQADRDRFLTALYEQGQLINYELTLRQRSGRPVHVLESATMLTLEDGSTCIEGNLVDITVIRRAEQEQRELLHNYRQLMERVREAVLVVQADVVRYANPAANVVWGGPVEQGEPVAALFASGGYERLIDQAEGHERFGPTLLFSPDGSKELVVHLDRLVYMGQESVQLMVTDPVTERLLLQERSRADVAEEVNAVLRKEIEEHRRTQEELRRSRQFARNLVDSSLDAIIAVDQQGRITEFNPAAGVKFGYEPEEVLGKHGVLLYQDPEEHDRVYRELAQYGAFAGEVRNKDHTGKPFISFLTASRLFDEKGTLLGSMGVSRDITQAKKDQEELKAREEQYRDLFENATDLIHSVDSSGAFLYVNRAWKQALGYNDADLPSLRILDIVLPEQRDAYARKLSAIIGFGQAQVIEATYLAKDGRQVQVTGNSNARLVNGKAVATRTILRDITETSKAKREVKEHQARLRALFESGDHMFWTVDQRLALTSFNLGYANMVERLHGVRPELNLDRNKPRTQFAPAEYHGFWEEKYAEAFSGKVIRFGTDLVDKHGNRVCNEVFLSPIFDAAGGVHEIFGIGHEVTEQRLAENKVKEQAARLDSIFGSTANMMVWTLDTELRITSFNEYFAQSGAENMGMDMRIGADMLEMISGHVSATSRADIVSQCALVMRGEPQQFEVELLGPDGSVVWLETFLNPIRLEGRVVGISCLAYGVTDKKQAQSKLLESLHEKEVLLKEVHHRVKNNLQIISSILNLKSSLVEDEPRMRDVLRESQDRIRSMAFIHESLYRTKNFSHVDLADYIDSLSRNLMMSYGPGDRVQLVRELDPVQLGLDQAIPCGLIINELISNALKHAFPNGAEGTITVRLGLEGDRVQLSVADDGMGMPADFDMEQHANLGLQLVETLTEQLDGALTRSTGKGAAYLITFDRIK